MNVFEGEGTSGFILPIDIFFKNPQRLFWCRDEDVEAEAEETPGDAATRSMGMGSFLDTGNLGAGLFVPLEDELGA